MLGIFIPSYNRPLQLLALLESIHKNNDCLFENIHVRYQGTTDLHRKAYQKLLEHPICESIDIKPKCGISLSRDMYDVMEDERYDFFGFITDDSLFYRPFCLKLEDFYDFMRSDVNHFSFRLGFNTKVVDYSNPEYKEEITNYKLVGPFVKFPWVHHRNHYGFSCAIDSSIFWREYILRETQESCGINFDYRYFEARLNEHLRLFCKRHQALCLPQSVLVNVPVNQVTEGTQVKHGLYHKYTPDELSQKFLDGYKIDLSKIDPNSIVSVQQEIPFHFIKDE